MAPFWGSDRLIRGSPWQVYPCSNVSISSLSFETQHTQYTHCDEISFKCMCGFWCALRMLFGGKMASWCCRPGNSSVLHMSSPTSLHAHENILSMRRDKRKLPWISLLPIISEYCSTLPSVPWPRQLCHKDRSPPRAQGRQDWHRTVLKGWWLAWCYWLWGII